MEEKTPAGQPIVDREKVRDLASELTRNLTTLSPGRTFSHTRIRQSRHVSSPCPISRRAPSDRRRVADIYVVRSMELWLRGRVDVDNSRTIQERRHALRASNHHPQFCPEHARIPPPAGPLFVPDDLRRRGQPRAVRPKGPRHRVLARHPGRPRHGRTAPRGRRRGARHFRSPEGRAHARRAALRPG